MTEFKRLPKIEPIVPKAKNEPFNDLSWSFEFKYDGFRGLLYITNGEAYFLSKSKKYLPRFDRLARTIAAELKVRNVILDGELVIFDIAKRPIFMDLMRQKKEPEYVAFDILWLNDRDLRELPLVERRKHLHRVIPKNSAAISQAFSVRGRGQTMFAFMREHDLEGIIAKRFKDPYNPRVTWYKIKNKSYSQLQERARLFLKK